MTTKKLYKFIPDKWEQIDYEDSAKLTGKQIKYIDLYVYGSYTPEESTIVFTDNTYVHTDERWDGVSNTSFELSEVFNTNSLKLTDLGKALDINEDELKKAYIKERDEELNKKNSQEYQQYLILKEKFENN